MLTRLKVSGFKNLLDLDVSFGPLTCIVGANGVGKSNILDAIFFLAALADRSLVEAAQTVRATGSDLLDPGAVFLESGAGRSREMRLEAEILIPPAGVGDLGQEARAAITFLAYKLALGRQGSALTILHEELCHITLGSARKHLHFPHRLDWRRSVVTGRRTTPLHLPTNWPHQHHITTALTTLHAA